MIAVAAVAAVAAAERIVVGAAGTAVEGLARGYHTAGEGTAADLGLVWAPSLLAGYSRQAVQSSREAVVLRRLPHGGGGDRC